VTLRGAFEISAPESCAAILYYMWDAKSTLEVERLSTWKLCLL
jgi:hypothetical protein